MFSTPHNDINWVPVKNIKPKYPVEETEVLNFRLNVHQVVNPGLFPDLVPSSTQHHCQVSPSVPSFLHLILKPTWRSVKQMAWMEQSTTSQQRTRGLSSSTPDPASLLLLKVVSNEGCSSASHVKLLRDVYTRSY